MCEYWIDPEKRNSDDNMLFEGEFVVNHTDFLLAVNTWAAKICDLIPGKSNRIGIYMQNSIDYVIAYYSVLLSNNIVVPISSKVTSHEIEFILSHLSIGILITNQENYEKIKTILRASINTVDVRIIIQKGFCREEILLALCERGRTPNDIALILHTSGSLSRPKSVMLTQKNLLSCARAIIQDLCIAKEDKTLVWLPVHYASANTSQLITHVLIGAKLVFTNLFFTAENFFSLIERYCITNTTLTPTLLLRLLGQSHLLEKYSISSLRYLCYGGASSPQEKISCLIEEYPSIQFVHMYGQIEAATRISHYFEPSHQRKLGCVGKPIPGTTCWIETESGEVVKPNEHGEVVVAGEHIMQGYCNRPEETRNAVVRGCLHTGDIGYMDNDGDLFIVGRKKNIIIKGGGNIHPEEIEEVLLSLDAVEDAVVVGEADEQWGEVPVAFIAKKGDSSLCEKQVFEFCVRMLSPYKVPKTIRFIDEIARTPNGKLARALPKTKDG